jgi:hypothetical protein
LSKLKRRAMNFTTKIPITQNLNPIDYNAKIVSFGSYFAQNIRVPFAALRLCEKLSFKLFSLSSYQNLREKL